MPTVIDTNVLMDYPRVLDEFKDIILPVLILEELDKLKINRDKERAWKARRAINKINETPNITFEVKENYAMPPEFDKDKADNKIMMCAKNNGADFITNDIACRIKAESIGINVLGYKGDSYTGVHLLEGTTEEILDFYNNGGTDSLLENQYLVVRNTDIGTEDEMVMRNGVLQTLRLPPSTYVKGWNSHQRCALDLLHNKDIPIKVICGVAGSGKTKLAVMVGLHSVLEKSDYDKLTLVRNIIGAGEDIGYLKGGVEEKTCIFYKPIIDNIDEGEEVVRHLECRKKLEKNIPFHMKGITLKDTFCIVDEAEDLDVKTLKLIGTRIGKDAVVVFCGDFAQAESKFANDNGLVKMIDKLKGDPLVGIVVLDDDVRSDASKVFVDL